MESETRLKHLSRSWQRAQISHNAGATWSYHQNMTLTRTNDNLRLSTAAD